MAQADAMETAKEVLRQLIKYRFWIAISAAALFALIAYTVGSGPIRAAAASETSKIKGAETEVQNYASNSIPTKEYKPIVEEKTQVLDKDVLSAWRTLYDRQAPLLTWPEGVQERFQTWGRQWPDKVNPRTIELAKVDFIEAYPSYVKMVYKTFNPFDYETGEGVVAAPPEPELLLPAQFSQEHLPDLGKIWAAQERLWIQRTVLEVIAEVNKNAKKWDEAIIRQIVSLEVGSPDTQDQRSLAKSETLEESKPIYAPGEEPPAADASSAATGSRGGGMMGGGMMGGGMMGGGGGMTGGGDAPSSVFYVKSDSTKFKVLPLAVTVLIEQDRVQDFLIELENSPMSIQVKDIEIVRPTTRVARPEKGEAGGGFGTMGGGMMGGRMGMGGMVGMGGMAGQMEQQMRGMMTAQRGAMQGMGGMGSGMMGGGMGQQATTKKKGADKRDTVRKDEREKTSKALEDAKGPSLVDPFFNIVQVRVYGQARFFNAPPADEAPTPSMNDAAAAAAPADSKSGEAAGKAAPAKDAEAKAGDTKDASTKDAEAKDANTKETDTKNAKTKDGETKDAESKDDENKDADAKDAKAKAGSAPEKPATPSAKATPEKGANGAAEKPAADKPAAAGANGKAAESKP